MTEQTPQFWRKSILEHDVWRATLGGCHWRLVKNVRNDPPGWFLFGIDPDGEVTNCQYMAMRLGPAKQAGERWICRPWERDSFQPDRGYEQPAPVEHGGNPGLTMKAGETRWKTR